MAFRACGRSVSNKHEDDVKGNDNDHTTTTSTTNYYSCSSFPPAPPAATPAAAATTTMPTTTTSCCCYCCCRYCFCHCDPYSYSYSAAGSTTTAIATTTSLHSPIIMTLNRQCQAARAAIMMGMLMVTSMSKVIVSMTRVTLVVELRLIKMAMMLAVSLFMTMKPATVRGMCFPSRTTRFCCCELLRQLNAEVSMSTSAPRKLSGLEFAMGWLAIDSSQARSHGSLVRGFTCCCWEIMTAGAGLNKDCRTLSCCECCRDMWVNLFY